MKNWNSIDPTAGEATAAEGDEMIMEVVLSTLEHLHGDRARRVYLAHVAFGVPLPVLATVIETPLQEVQAMVRTADTRAGSLLRDLVGQVGVLSVAMSPGVANLARRLGVLAMISCRACGEPMTFRSRGRPPRYCSSRCRKAGHRRAIRPLAEAGLPADHLHGLSGVERVRLVAEVPGDLGALLLARLDPAERARVLNRMPRTRAVAVLDALPIEHVVATLPMLIPDIVRIVFAARTAHTLSPRIARLSAAQVAAVLRSAGEPYQLQMVLKLPPQVAAGALVWIPEVGLQLVRLLAPKHATVAAALLLRLPPMQAHDYLHLLPLNISGQLMGPMTARQAAFMLEGLATPGNLPTPEWAKRARIAASLLRRFSHAKSVAIMRNLGAAAARTIRNPPPEPGRHPNFAVSRAHHGAGHRQSAWPRR